MYIKTRTGQWKASTVVIGLVVTIVGCLAVYNSELYTVREIAQVTCKAIPDCPSNWLTMENVFAGTSITCLILSAISLALGHVTDISCSGRKSLDAAYHLIGGIVVIVGAALLIASAIRLDKNTVVEIAGIRFEAPFVARDYQRYSAKLFAGAAGIINGLIYFVTARSIYSTQPTQ